MAITVDWGTRVITIPQADLTFISGDLYELDTDWFRLQLKALEAGSDGMAFPDTHRHNTTVTVAGTSFARTVEIINGYSVTFEDGMYAVRLVGSNNNIFDAESGILNVNQVSIISTNSAGLILAPTMSGDIAAAVMAELVESGVDLREAMRIILAVNAGKLSGATTATITIRDVNDSKNRVVATVDGDGNRTAVTLDTTQAVFPKAYFPQAYWEDTYFPPTGEGGIITQPISRTPGARFIPPARPFDLDDDEVAIATALLLE